MITQHRLLQKCHQLNFNNTISLVAFLPSYFSAEECQRIIELSKGQQQFTGMTGDGKVDSDRKSTVTFVEPGQETQWVFDKLERALMDLNKNYRFELQGFYEGFQVAKYESPGGYYNWHVDIGNNRASTRKLSMSVQLTDGSEYEGGELEFLATDEMGPKEIGSLIVFPSYLAHKVRPVSQGVRWSMVSWIAGPPFK